MSVLLARVCVCVSALKKKQIYSPVGKFAERAKQEALLLQRDRATRLSVQNIPFENDCNRQMTLKFIRLRSS